MLSSFDPSSVLLKTITVSGAVDVFYREAGTIDKPTLLLLHGFPNSSFYFRNLIPLLSSSLHLVAPDLPGFGFTKVPSDYVYTFENLSRTLESFVDAVGLQRFSIYIFDHGAPTGLRMALRIPERIEAIVTQNGNAYEVGLGDAWAVVQAYWKTPDTEHREAVKQAVLGLASIKEAYFHGVPEPSKVAPETYTLDNALTSGPNTDIQLDLFLDYQHNVAIYPYFQIYFGEFRPRLLVIWGENDALFTPPGAFAYKRDLPAAEVHFLNTGHFALETNVGDIARRILAFFQTN